MLSCLVGARLILIVQIAFLNTRNMVFANRTYLDSLNRYIGYYAITKLCWTYQKEAWFLQSPIIYKDNVVITTLDPCLQKE
jgi:abortive infection bacteriophage resistance protein